MSLKKMVNGVVVDCTAAEEAEIRLLWAATEATPPAVAQRFVDRILNDPEQLAALKDALAR